MNRPATAAVEAHGYQTLRLIGRGSQGQVWLVRHTGENVAYVLKRMHIMEPDARRAALLEAETLQRLQHTAIVGYRDTFVDDEHLCLVMEYADSGDLGTRIAAARDRPFSEEQVLQWFVQLAFALHHVHERGVLHRDLKTQNVFVSGPNAHVKLGDFGIAKQLANDEAALAATCVGTPYYMPPELFRGESYGTKADVWALGCVLYELLTRRRAFQAPNLNSLSVKVLRGDHGPLPPSYSSNLHDLVRSLLSVNATSRPSVTQVLATPFLRPHIAAYASEMLGAHTEAQVLASPALATLRNQLATCCGMQHPLPPPRAMPASSSAASIERANAPGVAAPYSLVEPPPPLTARPAPVMEGASPAYGSNPASSRASPPPPSQPAAELRVDSALRKLEEERRRRQRERRDGRACRSLGVASSHAQGHTPDPLEPKALAHAHAAAEPADELNVAARGSGPRLSKEAVGRDVQASPPMHMLPEMLPGSDSTFRHSRGPSLALHGRRAGHARSSSNGDELADSFYASFSEPNSARRSGDEPDAPGATPPPPFVLPDSMYGNTATGWPRDDAEGGGGFGGDTQERFDRIIGEAGGDRPYAGGGGGGGGASMMASTKEIFVDLGGLIDVSDAENASSVRNLPAYAEREVEAALVGLSAKERVLAKKELRKRQEEAAREGDLAAARQRYFQERVLADNAQRSQYLGSFVPYSMPGRAAAS